MISLRPAVLVGVMAMLAVATTGHTQTYPARDITFIVPFAPGGSTDPAGRMFAQELEAILKRNVVVENKPGGSATIGTAAVVTAAPDGYTLGLSSNGTLAQQPHSKKNLPWKNPDDYQSIVKLADLPGVLFVRAEAPWATFDEFMEHVKKSPGKVRVSVPGLRTSPDLVLQQLNRQAGTKLVTMPFSGGGGEGMLAVLGGRVEAGIGFPATLKGQVDAGKVRALGVFQKGKHPMFPDATPIGDTAYTATLPVAYYVIAPKGLPDSVRDTLIAAAKEAVMKPGFVKFAKDNGYVPDPKAGDEMKTEIQGYHKIFDEILAFIDSSSK